MLLNYFLVLSIVIFILPIVLSIVCMSAFLIYYLFHRSYFWKIKAAILSSLSYSIKLIDKYYTYILPVFMFFYFPVTVLMSDTSLGTKYVVLMISLLPIAFTPLGSRIKRKAISNYFKDRIILLPIISFLYVVLLFISFLPDIELISDEVRTVLAGAIVTFLAIRRLVDDIVKQIDKKAKEVTKTIN